MTGKNVSWEIRHNKSILRLKTLKKNIKPHQNFTDFYKKGIVAPDQLKNLYIEYQKSKVKKVSKLWQKLSNILTLG